MHNSLLFNASKDASWINARRLQQHHKKLQEIRSRSVQALPTTSLRHSLKGISYLEAERLYTIKRDNRLLMRKLVSIAESKGDRSKPGLGVLRSMNLAVRKREDDRIRSENYNLGKRLVHIEAKTTTSVPHHHYSKSSAFRSPSKALFKVTAMVASESRLNSTVIEEVKPRLRGKQDLNRSAVDLHKGQSGITLAQYLDAKGDIAIIADIKSVKKKPNLGEFKAVPRGNMSKSVSKLEIVKLPGCDLKAIAQVTASKPPLYTLPIAYESVPPLQLSPAVHSSQHSTPVPTHSSKARLQRLETIHGASPHSQTLAGLQSASLSKQVSVASEELGELEEQYSEDAHHEEESRKSSLESEKSGRRRVDLGTEEKKEMSREESDIDTPKDEGIEEKKETTREESDKDLPIALGIEEKKEIVREESDRDIPKDEGSSEPQEAHIEMQQLPLFSAEENEGSKAKQDESAAVEIAASSIEPGENTEIAAVLPAPIEGNQALPLPSVPDPAIQETFSKDQSPPSPQAEEIKAEEAVNSPKQEDLLPVLEGSDGPAQESPTDIPEIGPISSHHSEKLEDSKPEEQVITPYIASLPAELVLKRPDRSGSAPIASNSPHSAENRTKKARNHTASHWTVPDLPISATIIPEEVVNFAEEVKSSTPVVLPDPPATQLEPISLSESLPPASVPTNSPPLQSDQAVIAAETLLLDPQPPETPKSPLKSLIPA